MTRASRISRASILEPLRHAARTGDRAALTIALDQMKVWALSPRYWERYLDLLTHPLARLVDLAVIKQGERIARQKGWAERKRPARSPAPARGTAGGRRRRSDSLPSGRPAQARLFSD